MARFINTKNNVLILGGYKLEKTIASALLKKGFSVTVVNEDRDMCSNLAEIQGINVIMGDPTKRSILEDASVKHMNMVIAVTDSDEKNLVICEICKSYYGVKRTVALLEDGGKSSFFYNMGVDRIISPLNIMAAILEEDEVKEELSNRISISKGGLIIEETPLHNGSGLSGKKLWELNLPKEIIIVCIMRGDKNLIPRGDTTLMENDILLLLSSDQKKLDNFISMATK